MLQNEDKTRNVEPVDEESIYSEMGYPSNQFPYSLVRKKSIPRRRSAHFNRYYNTLDDFRSGFETKDLAAASGKGKLISVVGFVKIFGHSQPIEDGDIRNKLMVSAIMVLTQPFIDCN